MADVVATGRSKVSEPKRAPAKADGRRAVWQVCKQMAWQFHLAVYGTTGLDQARVTFEDRYTIFRETAARMVEFVQRRTSPVPVAETIEIVRLLESVRNAQRVS